MAAVVPVAAFVTSVEQIRITAAGIINFRQLTDEWAHRGISNLCAKTGKSTGLGLNWKVNGED